MTLTTKRLVFILIIVASIFFLLGFCTNQTNSKKFDKLETENKVLQNRLDQRSVKIDSLTNKIEMDSLKIAGMLDNIKLLQTVNDIYQSLDNKYDHEIDNILNLSHDSSVVFFTNWLNKLDYRNR